MPDYLSGQGRYRNITEAEVAGLEAVRDRNWRELQAWANAACASDH